MTVQTQPEIVWGNLPKNIVMEIVDVGLTFTQQKHTYQNLVINQLLVTGKFQLCLESPLSSNTLRLTE